MKHTVPLGNNRYVRLDSYGESPKTRRMHQVICFVLFTIIAGMSIPALMGIDITNTTNTQPIQNHDAKH